MRRDLRAQRMTHVAAVPAHVRGLLFSRPPRALDPLLAAARIVGLYAPLGQEPRTDGYAAALVEGGKALALPWFADRRSPMQFRRWHWPEDLSPGPFGVMQPPPCNPVCIPDLLFVPLVGFDHRLMRLGQGGGHYDRWLASHPATPAIGLAWSVQQVDCIPAEPHDRPLHRVITETAIHEPVPA